MTTTGFTGNMYTNLLVTFSLMIASSEALFPISFAMCTNTTAQANQPLLVKGLYNTSANTDEGWDAYRVYLAKGANFTEAVSGPVCRLIDCLPMSQSSSPGLKEMTVTNFALTMSPEWGPPGKFYDVAAWVFNQKDVNVPDKYNHASSSLFYTNGFNGFNATGMTGSWYGFESNPSSQDFNHDWPWGLDLAPCAAYDCARKCVDQDYDPAVGLDVEAYARVSTCMSNCDGYNTTTNYCPQAGGTAYSIPSGVDTSFVPDGCTRFDAEEFPAAAASASASASASSASAAAAAAASSTSQTAGSASSTSTSSASVVRFSLHSSVILAILISCIILL